VKKLACLLCVLGTTMGLSATGARAWDEFDAMMRTLQTPWQGLGQGQWQWQAPWRGLWQSQPAIKGNDTGGIIAWSPDNEALAREWTTQFCAGYGKYPRITSVHRQSGDFITFNCLWDPTVARYALPEARVRGR
jgi:hypothetical protein